MYLENQLAAVGGVKFSNSVPTAGISEKELLINPGFFQTLNETEKRFLIEHELLHLILKHHSRFGGPSLHNNIGCDLAINSILQKRFCGDKDPSKVIPNLYDDGYFPSKCKFPEGQTADWYIEAIRSNPYLIQQKSTFGSSLNKNLSSLEDAVDGIFANDSGMDTQIKEIKKKERYSFLSLVQSLVGNRSFRNDYGYVERFGRNRRFDSLLPTSVLSEGDLRIRKNKILLFLDYSGSCRNMINDFNNASSQIPTKLFEIVKFKFADFVVPFSADDGYGGGTHYPNLIIEAKKHSYDMVWVFSDGEGYFSDVMKDPQKWHWFLDGSQNLASIPKGCHIHFLQLLKRKR